MDEGWFTEGEGEGDRGEKRSVSCVSKLILAGIC